MSKKKKNKKINPFKAAFGAMMSSIGTASPMDAYYGGNPDIHNFQGAAQGIPDPNHIPTRELKPATVNTDLLPVNAEKPDVYKNFQKAPDTISPLPTTSPDTKKKGALGSMDTGSINVKTITGSILPAINSMITDRHKIRTAPLLPLEVYNPYPQGTGSQAIMDSGGKIKRKSSQPLPSLNTTGGDTLPSIGIANSQGIANRIMFDSTDNRKLKGVASPLIGEYSALRQDLQDIYFGRKPKNSRVQSTSVLPTRGYDGGMEHYAINDPEFNNGVLDTYRKIMDMEKAGKNLPRGTVKTKDGSYVVNSPRGSGNALGHYTISPSPDNSYISYYDKWDNSLYSGGPSVDNLMGGKPFGVYGRIPLEQKDSGGVVKPPKGKYKIDPVREKFDLHDMLTYTLANGRMPKSDGMAAMMRGNTSNQQLLTDAQMWSQRTDQLKLSPEDRINSYFNRPVGENPIDIQRAELKSLGYGPTATWRNSPNIDLQQQSGSNPDLPLAKHASGGKLSASKAREMLKNPPRGKKLTKKQKRYFGMVAAGKAENGMELDEAFWGAIVSAVGGQAAGQGGQKLGAAIKENVKNAAQAPQEIMNFLSQITAASRYTPEGTPMSPNLSPEQMRYENGGSLRGDDISVLWGGQAKRISENPYDGGTVQFNGASHENDGIGINYGGKSVEVEGAETAVKDAQGNLNIMGNMNVPGSGIKFKSMSKKISEKEKEYDKIKTTGSILVNTYDPYDKWDKLKFNSGKVMMEGGDLGQQDIVKKKADLAALQNSLLETAEEYNLNPDALSRGQMKKAKKGTFEKAASGAKLDPTPKFKQLRALAEANLKAKYPNSKVEIIETGAERPIKEQRGLKSRKASKTSVSLHNVGGARDYMIYKDGKLVRDKGIYKEVLHPLAQHLGLHPIGDWDAGHIGAVKEGKGTNPFSTLLREHPDLKDKPLTKDTISFLDNLVKGKKADSQEIRAYNQLTGSNVASTQAVTPNYKEAEQYLPQGQGEWFNQNLVPPDQPIWEPGTPVPQVFKLPTIPLIYKEPTPATPEIVTPPNDLPPVVQKEEEPLPSNAQNLGLSQILPELVAMGQNQYEPVAMQQFAPLLEQPYQVSFQDRLNANTSTFRSLERQVQDSPTALSALAAQQYGANQQVMADEFRFNQGEANRVYNANRNTLNQAEMTNMGLRDQQYVRQSTARSKTKAQTHEILSSISNKYNQNRLNNQKLALYENMYNYRFQDKNKDGIAAEAVNMNPDPAFNFNLLSNPTTATNPFSRVRVEKDPATGTVKKRTEMTPSELDKAILQLRLEKEQRNKPLITIPKLFNNSR